MRRKQQAAILCRAFLMTILYLNPLLLLSSCTAGDIGSSASNSNASVDQSDDHSITGDTECSISCNTQPDGRVDFIKTCNGAQTSSGTFNDGTTCQQIAEEENAELEAPSDSQEVLTQDEAGSLNQGGTI